ARDASAPVFGQLEGDRAPIVDARAVAAAVYDSRGRQIAATRAFEDGGCQRMVDVERLADFAAGADPAWVTIARADDPSAASGLIAYAPGERTSTWRIPREIHEAAEAHPRAVVVLTTVLDTDAPPLRDACLAYGLTGLQTRVALATIRTGAIKDAASALGLSYQTARGTLAEAMKRVGV